MKNYSVGLYRDSSDARRNRYAVLCGETNVWYFPKRYGLQAAVNLSAKMNKESDNENA